MQTASCRKAYVSVNLDVDKESVFYPRLIPWDNGLVFQIEQILYKCRASSKKVSGGGIRYTVMIKPSCSVKVRNGLLKQGRANDDFISRANRRNSSSNDKGLQ